MARARLNGPGMLRLGLQVGLVVPVGWVGWPAWPQCLRASRGSGPRSGFDNGPESAVLLTLAATYGSEHGKRKYKVVTKTKATKPDDQ